MLSPISFKQQKYLVFPTAQSFQPLLQIKHAQKENLLCSFVTFSADIGSKRGFLRMFLYC